MTKHKIKILYWPFLYTQNDKYFNNYMSSYGLQRWPLRSYFLPKSHCLETKLIHFFSFQGTSSHKFVWMYGSKYIFPKPKGCPNFCLLVATFTLDHWPQNDMFRVNISLLIGTVTVIFDVRTSKSKRILFLLIGRFEDWLNLCIKGNYLQTQILAHLQFIDCCCCNFAT